MVTDPIKSTATSNIMLAANLITKMNLGPLFTGIKPLITMQSGFLDFIPETTETFNLLKKNITSVYNDYFNSAKKRIPLANIAYELSNSNDGGIIKSLDDLIKSMQDFQGSAELSKSKNFDLLNRELQSLIVKLTNAKAACNAAFQALNKLSQPQQQPAAVATASIDYQVNKMVRLANLIAKKYEY